MPQVTPKQGQIRMMQGTPDDRSTPQGWDITPASLIAVVIGGAVVFIGVGLLYASFVGFDISTDRHAWADFGTFYGGMLGPLVSLFAFLGLVVTLRFQAIQIAQLERTSEQNRLEQTVSGLLSTLGTIVAGLSVNPDDDGHAPSGAKAFRSFYRALDRKFKRVKAVHGEDTEAAVNAAYDLFYSAYGSYVGHYFRTIYTIVKIIDEKAPSRQEADRLVALLTCRLSRFELLLLHYNGASALGTRKFKPLITKYALLENVDVDKLLRFGHLQLYPAGAFGATQRLASVTDHAPIL